MQRNMLVPHVGGPPEFAQNVSNDLMDYVVQNYKGCQETYSDEAWISGSDDADERRGDEEDAQV